MSTAPTSQFIAGRLRRGDSRKLSANRKFPEPREVIVRRDRVSCDAAPSVAANNIQLVVQRRIDLGMLGQDVVERRI